MPEFSEMQIYGSSKRFFKVNLRFLTVRAVCGNDLLLWIVSFMAQFAIFCKSSANLLQSVEYSIL